MRLLGLSIILLLVLNVNQSSTVQSLAADLFFSEYIEGTNSNRAIEIYNGTGAEVDLSGYRVETYFNGNISPLTNIIYLSGTIANGDVLVIVHTFADDVLKITADLENGTALNFTGDDTVVLRKNDLYLDVIGQVGFDPGTNWTVGGGSTSEYTLIRKPNICAGDTIPNNNFTGNEEWNVHPQNTFSNLGSHFSNCIDVPPTITTTNPLDDATGVATNSNIEIMFSEAVSVSSIWVQIDCTVSDLHSAEISGGPEIYTLNPHNDFAPNETCTVTVYGAQITDSTLNTMTDDYSFTFSTALSCNSVPDKIYELQENGTKHQMGIAYTVDGIVTADFPHLSGYFLQDVTGDGNELTSDGIFIYDSSLDVQVGDRVIVNGLLAEVNNETRLNTTAALICQSNLALPIPISLNLPVGDFENYEGMLVTFPQALTVTDVNNLRRYNQFTLSNGRLFMPTHLTTPGSSAQAQQSLNNRSQVTVDDGSNIEYPATIIYPPPELTAMNPLRNGDTVTGLAGILTQNTSGYRVHPTTTMSFNHTNLRPTLPPDVGGTLKVASFDLSNYFDTFPNSTPNGCFGPAADDHEDCRGASNSLEFTRQRDKLIKAIAGIDAHIIGITELENEIGSGVIQTLVNGLNTETILGTYGFINTGQIGTDAIRTGIIYKPGKVTPVNPVQILNTTSFENPAIAQSFSENATGAQLTLVVTHFKSRGNCPTVTHPGYTDPVYGENYDTGDGHNCWNASRQRSVDELINWLTANPTGVSDPDVLIMGNFNSYMMEEPVTRLQNSGYTNVNTPYTSIFDGQAGNVNYGFTTSPLLPQIVGAAVWHLNADEPSALDYNTEWKSPSQITNLYHVDSYRSAEHDPLVVGLDLDYPLQNFNLLLPETGTSYGDISSNITLTWEAVASANTYHLTLTRPNESDLIVNDLTPSSDSDGLTCNQTICVYTIDNSTVLTGNGSYEWSVTAENTLGTLGALNNPFTFTVNVIPPTATFTPIPPTSTFTAVPPTMTNTQTSSTVTATSEWVSATPPTSTATHQVAITSTNTPIISTSTIDPLLPTATSTSTPLPFGSVELLRNGSFETNVAPADNLPDHWTGKRLNRDKLKCNTSNKIFAFKDKCAFMFTGGIPEKTKLLQAPDLNGYNLEQGDTLNLSVHYRTKGTNAPRLRLMLVIVYPSDTMRIKVMNSTVAKTYTYFPVPVHTVDTSPPTEIKVVIQNKTLSGKIFIDEVSLIFDPVDDEPSN